MQCHVDMSLLLQEPKLISLHDVVSSKIYQLIWSYLRDLWSALLLCFASHKCTSGAGWQKNIVLEKSDLTESKAKMFIYLMGSRGCLPVSPCPHAAHFPVWSCEAPCTFTSQWLVGALSHCLFLEDSWHLGFWLERYKAALTLWKPRLTPHVAD